MSADRGAHEEADDYADDEFRHEPRSDFDKRDYSIVLGDARHHPLLYPRCRAIFPFVQGQHDAKIGSDHFDNLTIAWLHDQFTMLGVDFSGDLTEQLRPGYLISLKARSIVRAERNKPRPKDRSMKHKILRQVSSPTGIWSSRLNLSLKLPRLIFWPFTTSETKRLASLDPFTIDPDAVRADDVKLTVKMEAPPIIFLQNTVALYRMAQVLL